MRILVEQSGYEGENLGDRAMLQAGLLHIARLWPDAQVTVLSAQLELDGPENLAVKTVPPFPSFKSSRLPSRITRGGQLLAKRYGPRTASSRLPNILPSYELIKELKASDVLLATGGGFLNDHFSMHGSSVLSVLEAAQRSGLPTAMFGQGIGPLTGRRKVEQLKRVLLRLNTLGIREPTTLRELARLNIDLGLTVTGDEALILALADGNMVGARDSIGLNVRVQDYSGVNESLIPRLRNAVLTLQRMFQTQLIAIPITHNQSGADLEMISAIAPSEAELLPIPTIPDLVTTVNRCHIVVTGSYHAGVFALAQGIPIVALTANKYYDNKFGGLAELFPNSVKLVSFQKRNWDSDLFDAAEYAWNLPTSAREVAKGRALSLSRQCSALWDQFAEKVTSYRAA